MTDTPTTHDPADLGPDACDIQASNLEVRVSCAADRLIAALEAAARWNLCMSPEVEIHTDHLIERIRSAAPPKPEAPVAPAGPWGS